MIETNITYREWLTLRATVIDLFNRGRLSWADTYMAIFHTGRHINYYS